MVCVINLLSDDDDESPAKAAQSALQSFGARKERRFEGSGVPIRKEDEDPELSRTSPRAARSVLESFKPRKNGGFGGSGAGHPAHEPKSRDGYDSPGQAARSALSSFLPRKERQSGILGLSHHRQHVATAKDGEHLGQDRRKETSRSSDMGNEDTLQPEQGSLVALLQQAQTPIDSSTLHGQPRPAPGIAPSSTAKLASSLIRQATDPTKPGFSTSTVGVGGKTGKIAKSPRLNSNEPRLGKTAPAEVRPGTPVTANPAIALPRSVKSSRSSGKKGTKPWHILHKNLLKPLLDEATSTPNRDLSAGQADPLARHSKQNFVGLNNAPATEAPVERSAPPGQRPKAKWQVSNAQQSLPKVKPLNSGTQSNFGNQYTPEEDALLAELKEVRNVRWEDMPQYFEGRTKGSLQVRYSSKVSKRHHTLGENPGLSKPSRFVPRSEKEEGSDSATVGDPRKRRKRNNDVSAASGMISWAEVSRLRRLVGAAEGVESRESSLPRPDPKTSAQFDHERAHPRSLTKHLRQRELGSGGGRYACSRRVPDELKQHVYDDIGPLKYHKGTSGDVTSIAWSSNSTHFAASSIAISDERNMQYNRPGNLIVGDHAKGILHELSEHHLPRPAIAAEGNANSLHAMRESQDPRLFMTVANVQFSPDGQTLYSAGTDAKVRAYDVSGDYVRSSFEIQHAAPLDLLSVSNLDVLATACHQSTDGSIGIYKGQEHLLALSPSRAEQQTNRAIYPSALRWGISHHHSNLLLAGFSIDSIDEERDIAGETCLWDVAVRRRIHLPVTRNVFDVAWNPRPSSTSTVFAVASTPGTQKVTRSTRTVVQCFAPNQGCASRVLEWESPAFDINDVVYCQHDDNLIAAGATDGKVYVWDQRFAGRRPTPLHIFKHSGSLNVLDHDRACEIADTGVRFLSWGATSSRLYTGSSDGIVKIWNPYMATENAHIKDVATFGSAVMSGAFSPDYRDLLIGEDQGRINSLSIGHGDKTVRSMRKYEYISAPAPEIPEDRFAAAHELVRSQQIVFRPMGDLPIQQAVQGPKYAGLRLMPAAEELQSAQDAYNAALQTRSDARARADMLDDAETASAAREAERQVLKADETIKKLKSRREDAIKLYPRAFENQYALHKAEKQRYKLEASSTPERCKLDCNYLPASGDEDGEVGDSGRSQGRIPGDLRLQPLLDTAPLTPEDAIEAGLTWKCVSCSSPAAKPNLGLPVCERCAIARRGLTAKCERCFAAIKPPTDATETRRCEICSFACFRCSKHANVSKDRKRVRCDACRLTWTVGVLGYELIVPKKKAGRIGRRSMSGSIKDDLEFGEDEMERLAAKWGHTS